MRLKLTTIATAVVAVGIFTVPAQAGGSFYEGFYNFPSWDFSYKKNKNGFFKKHFKKRHHKKHEEEVDMSCHGACPDPEPEVGPHGETGGGDTGDHGGHEL